MLIYRGAVNQLSPWFAVELSPEATNESRYEEYVLKILSWATRRRKSFQLVFPVIKREMGGVTLLTPYIWVRGDLGNIRDAIPNARAKVDFMRNAEGVPIPVDNAFVQDVIKHCRTVTHAWSVGITPGAYVRILFGQYRMFCGRVTSEAGGLAEVDLALRVRHLKLSIPTSALENLGRSKREYFYTGD